jgi:hypothetical protein
MRLQRIRDRTALIFQAVNRSLRFVLPDDDRMGWEANTNLPEWQSRLLTWSQRLTWERDSGKSGIWTRQVRWLDQ